MLVVFGFKFIVLVVWVLKMLWIFFFILILGILVEVWFLFEWDLLLFFWLILLGDVFSLKGNVEVLALLMLFEVLLRII